MENNTAILTIGAFAVVLAFILGGLIMSTATVTEVEVPVYVQNHTVTLVPVEIPVDTSDYDLILEKQFEDYIDNIKERALEELEDELDKDYFEDLLKAEGIDVDKIRSYSIDEDEVEYKILSYDEDNDDEDKAEVTAEVKVKYTLREGSTDVMKKFVIVTGVYSLDDGEPELDLD